MDYSDKIREEVEKAAATVRSGGVVLYPTETVWGIGCDACRPEAVKRIFSIKRRAEAKALITLVDSVRMLERYVEEVPEVAYQLIDVAVEPLTIVYDGGRQVAPELLAEDGSIGIRVTTDDFCKSLIRALKRPIVSTSANISGVPAPAVFSQIDREIIDSVDHVVDLRHCETVEEAAQRRPSVVIKLKADGEFKILRG